MLYKGPKCRLCRREGLKLYLKGERCFTKCPIDRKGARPPGEVSTKGKVRRKLSEFGLRLREKQRLRRYYGVTERQFRRYFNQASKDPKNTGLVLLQTLETRLDNLVRRAGYVLSPKQARHLVGHGHILVNGQKVDIPSYNVKVGDVVGLTERASSLQTIKQASEKSKEMSTPAWVSRKGWMVKINRLPNRDEVPLDIDEKLVIEYYAR